MAIIEKAASVVTERSTEVRSFLSSEGQEHFDDIFLKRKLGATPNIYAIGCMLRDIATHAEADGLTAQKAALRMQKTADYFVELRGASSTAIVTAAGVLTDGLDTAARAGLSALREHVSRRVEAYLAEAEEWEKRITSYGVNLLRDRSSMLLYDYSSLVCAMLRALGEVGRSLDVYLPESRFLDGGRPFVRHCLDNGHKVHFFPDIAIMYFMEKADLALMGAETFFPNGDMANTIGSELVALACARYEKPLYIPTSLIKVDMKWAEGVEKKQLFRDLEERLASHWDEETRKRVDFVCPNLDVVPSKYITAYITENGVIPCPALYTVCRSFKADLCARLDARLSE